MSERTPNLRHYIEHTLFSSVAAVAGRLSDRAAARLGEGIGRLGYTPLHFRRALAEQHLRMAFPDADDAWIRRIARESYAHLGREALATMRLARMSREDLIQRTEVGAGWSDFQQSLAEGRGAVIVSGHVGNHEIAAAAIAARGIPLDIVVQQQENPLFNAQLNRARRRFGLGIIDRFQAHRLAIKALRGGRAVAFAADQNAGRSGMFVPFFGRPASTHRGAALFSVKTGAPLFVGSALRRGEGYEITAQRVDVDRTGPVDDVVYRLTAAFTARLEEVVRSAPGQYLWLHRRWKTKPPEAERQADKQV